MHIFLTGDSLKEPRQILQRITSEHPVFSGLRFHEIPETEAFSSSWIRELFLLLDGPDSILGIIPASAARLLGILSNRPEVLLLEVTAQNQEQTYNAVVDALFPSGSQSDNPPSCGAVVTRFREGHPEILLIRTRRGNWSFPKGRMNSGETEPMTAIREIREETGISTVIDLGSRWDISAIPVNKPGIRNDRRIILFMARAVGGIAQPQPSEVRELSWVPADIESADRIEFPPDRQVFLEALTVLRTESHL